MLKVVTNWLDERELARQKDRDQKLGIAPTQEALDARCLEAAKKGYWKTAQYALEKGAEAGYLSIDKKGFWYSMETPIAIAAIEAGMHGFIEEMAKRNAIRIYPSKIVDDGFGNKKSTSIVEAAIKANDHKSLYLISERMNTDMITDAMTFAEGCKGDRDECLALLNQQLQRKQQPRSPIQKMAAPVTVSKTISTAAMMESVAGLSSDADRERLFADLANKFPAAFENAAKARGLNANADATQGMKGFKAFEKMRIRSPVKK